VHLSTDKSSWHFWSTVHVTGLQTHAGMRVWVRQVQVRVVLEIPIQNPHPLGGFGGFLRLSFKILTAFVQKVTCANTPSPSPLTLQTPQHCGHCFELPSRGVLRTSSHLRLGLCHLQQDGARFLEIGKFFNLPFLWCERGDVWHVASPLTTFFNDL
jgi:hypothetical protein